MDARRITTQAAQGDVYVRRISAIPKHATKAMAEGGRQIVAHSGTGHHHYLDARGVERWEDPQDPLRCYLRIELGDVAGGAVLTHARPFDTHAPLALGPGIWEIRRQREMTPDGWRRVQD